MDDAEPRSPTRWDTQVLGSQPQIGWTEAGKGESFAPRRRVRMFYGEKHLSTLGRKLEGSDGGFLSLPPIGGGMELDVNMI
jgi:hypothetical protein